MAASKPRPMNLSERFAASQVAGAVKAVEDGSITSPRGFRAAGVHAGFRANPNRLDMALVVADEPCAAAGVFTTNAFCAAPVTVSREHLNGTGSGIARAVVVNSGIANAATGETGLEKARQTAELVADVVGCTAQEVLVASTGVIGQQLDLTPFSTGLPAAYQALSDAPQAGHDAATGIMTTDTVAKECAFTYTSGDPDFPGVSVTVGGMVKGAGMIMPNMATMIAVITTDAPIGAELAHQALADAVAKSFNKVTVDSDTSTNDTCFLLASGSVAPGVQMRPSSCGHLQFQQALDAVCTTLARKIAEDGEGSSRLVTVNVAGAATDADADAAARAIANSPLVKTAIFGHDCNWGRIAAAAGKSGAAFRQETCDIDIMGMPVCRKGLDVPFDEDEALRRFEEPEVVIDVNLGAGSCHTTIWTCDLTHEYVTINGEYRS